MSKYPFKQAKKLSYGNERALSVVRYICIHYTGNVGDSSKNNVDYFARYGDGNTRNAGAHFFVDQKGEVWQSIKLTRVAWAVGGFVTNKNGAAQYHLICTNTNSVSIELCDCATKDPSPAMIKATRELVAYIREKCPNANKIITHWQVSGKQCPARMTGDTEAGRKRWQSFVKAIDAKETAPAKKTVSYPTTTLKLGDTGAQVKRLQKCLNKLDNAKLEVDGSFGYLTDKAVRRFQKKHKLEVDGIVGPITRAKIKSLMTKEAE